MYYALCRIKLITFSAVRSAAHLRYISLSSIDRLAVTHCADYIKYNGLILTTFGVVSITRRTTTFLVL